MSEDRTCILCGKQVDAGMTNNEGIYAHEECFEDMMNAVYPYGWRPNPSGELGSHGGYYQAKESPADDWHDTGVYYTEWEKDDAPVESDGGSLFKDTRKYIESVSKQINSLSEKPESMDTIIESDPLEITLDFDILAWENGVFELEKGE